MRDEPRVEWVNGTYAVVRGIDTLSSCLFLLWVKRRGRWEWVRHPFTRFDNRETAERALSEWRRQEARCPNG